MSEHHSAQPIDNRRDASSSPNPVLIVEILGSILAQHLNSTPDNPDLHPPRKAVLLVCHRWYQTAISDPHCWTDLDLSMSLNYPLRYFSGNLESQFDRARHIPVNLTLRSTPSWINKRDTDMKSSYCSAIEELLKNNALKIRSYTEIGRPFACKFLKMISDITSKQASGFTVQKYSRLTHLHLFASRVLPTIKYQLPHLHSLRFGTLCEEDLAKFDCPNLHSLIWEIDLEEHRFGREPHRANHFLASLREHFPRLRLLGVPAKWSLDWNLTLQGVESLRTERNGTVEQIIIHDVTAVWRSRVDEKIIQGHQLSAMLKCFLKVNSLTFHGSPTISMLRDPSDRWASQFDLTSQVSPMDSITKICFEVYSGSIGLSHCLRAFSRLESIRFECHDPVIRMTQLMHTADQAPPLTQECPPLNLKPLMPLILEALSRKTGDAPESGCSIPSARPLNHPFLKELIFSKCIFTRSSLSQLLDTIEARSNELVGGLLSSSGADLTPARDILLTFRFCVFADAPGRVTSITDGEGLSYQKARGLVSSPRVAEARAYIG